MFATLPWPLAVALVLSYPGMAIVVAVAINLGRWPTRTARRTLLVGIGLGAASVALRTGYFLVA